MVFFQCRNLPGSSSLHCTIIMTNLFSFSFPFAAADAPETLEAVESALESTIESAESAVETVATTVAHSSTALILDVSIFIAFVLTVVFVGIFMGRKKKGDDGKESESYFLAGRDLGWWLIGFSLIAANISTEQFVGMSGDAANYVGLAIASYEWMAAVSLVFVAFFFLPQFLKTGIYTIPEFLEKRYNRFSRTLMSLLMVITLITVSFAAVVYAGAMTFEVLFKDVNLGVVPINLYTLSYTIGFVAMLYVACGGLKACAWADLLQGSALILGGGMILFFALKALEAADPAMLATTGGMTPELADKVAGQGAWDRFLTLNSDKLRMNLPWDDSKVPVTALFFGLWIPNFYYWGLNQYIVQRTLGSQSLSQGQKGIVFAAFMKLIIPFIVVFPGIIAFNLFSENLKDEALKPKSNGNVLATLDKVVDDPASLSFFDFNNDYAKLYPEKARDIVNYNAALVAQPIEGEMLTPDQIVAQQGILKAKAEGINAVRNQAAWKKYFGAKPTEGEGIEKPFIMEKQLVGYKYDSAFSMLVGQLIPPGYRGFMLAAILGALISSLAAVLNAASTIITMDIYKEYISPNASQKTQVYVGRLCVVVFGLIGCSIALFLDDPRLDGIFSYIQAFQGFISPGILAAFIFGFFARYAPACCGPTALLGSPVIYGLLMKFAPGIPFLDRMAITFAIVVAVLGFLTAFLPRKEPFVAKGKTTIDLRTSKSAKVGGVIVVVLTLCMYAYFWQYDWPTFNNFFTNLFYKMLP